jgi:predicted aconitase with swiveling domain
MKKTRVIKARKIYGGKATGPVLITKERLGLRGFVNPEKGKLTGGLGDLEGAKFAGAVVVFSCSKGSTTWCMALDLACRHGNAPAAFVNSKLDSFVALGSVLQDIPLVVVEDLGLFDSLNNGDIITVEADKGEITFESNVNHFG